MVNCRETEYIRPSATLISVMTSSSASEDSNMKISFALAISASVLQGVKGCYQGIIPDYHFVNLTNSPHVSEETRAWANATYWHGRNLKHGRQQTGGGSDGEGITGSDDDDEFDEDQDPSDAADLRKETKALHEAAKNDTPDPGAVEDTNRRRWTGAVTQNGKRQATDRLRAVWTDNMGCAKSPSSTLVRTENSSPAVDADMNTLFDGIGKVDNLFRNVYGRNAISGTGGYYYGTGHYCVRFMNAYWDGVQLVFGDGDGEVFATNSFINSLDVIGHEIGHGVVEYSNPLFYNGQSGALNEHLADVFGSLTLQHSQTQSASQATWLIGQGVVVNATALRSMKAPGTVCSLLRCSCFNP